MKSTNQRGGRKGLPDAISRELIDQYRVALKEGDLLTQYEVLRFVEANPTLLPMIEKVEAPLHNDIPEIPINWAAVKSNLRSGTRIVRVFDVLEKTVRRFEFCIRLVLSYWPVAAMPLFAWITQKAFASSDPVQSRNLLCIDFLIFGSVLILCSTHFWRRDGELSKAHYGTKVGLRSRITSISRHVLVCSSFMVVLFLLLPLYMERNAHDIDTLPSITKTSSLNAAGQGEIKLYLPSSSLSYLISAESEDASGPAVLSAYDNKGTLIGLGKSRTWEPSLVVRPDSSTDYDIRVKFTNISGMSNLTWAAKVIPYEEESNHLSLKDRINALKDILIK